MSAGTKGKAIKAKEGIASSVVLVCLQTEIADQIRPLLPKITVVNGSGEAPKSRKLILWPTEDEARAQRLITAWKALEKAPEIYRLPDIGIVPATADEAQIFINRAHKIWPTEANEEPVVIEEPFRCLGYRKGFYYFLAHGSQEVMELDGPGAIKSRLYALAPKSYWEKVFPGTSKKDPVDKESASDQLIRWCERMGVFNINRIRGRGVWWEDGQVVAHCGDKVFYKGISISPAKVPGRNIYEVADPIAIAFENPAPNSHGAQFVELISKLSWRDEISPLLLAGWCFIAPIAGALRWRPHIWVTGSWGSGKSYIMRDIVKKSAGKNAVFIQANSTEAGIRQMLAKESLPVIFDEAERENDNESNNRLKRVLYLVRQSSSEGEGVIAQGTQSGKGKSFIIHSCFCFGSINASIVQPSDMSRISILDLTQPLPLSEFEPIAAALAQLLQEDKVASQHARALMMVETIRKTADIMKSALSAHGARFADQLGTLLAGAYCLQNDSVPSAEQASDWLSGLELGDQRPDLALQNDESALLTYLMQQRIEVKVDRGTAKLAIGECVAFLSGKMDSHPELPIFSASIDGIKGELGRIGIKVSEDRHSLQIANNHSAIFKLLSQSRWGGQDYGKTLRRLKDAILSENLCFGNIKSRATSIPTDHVVSK